MRVAGAIFDLDGTLADTIAVSCLTFRRAVVRFGGPAFTDEEIRAQFGPSEDGMFQRALPGCWSAAFGAYVADYEAELAQCALFPGVAAVLTTLRERGVPLALVTGKSSPTTTLSLRRFGVDALFDRVETGSPGGSVKATALRRVVAAWGLPAPEVIYVGDAVADMDAAREAGVAGIAAAWAPTVVAAELAATDPQALFTSAADFQAWLLTTLAPSPARRTCGGSTPAR